MTQMLGNYTCIVLCRDGKSLANWFGNVSSLNGLIQGRKKVYTTTVETLLFSFSGSEAPMVYTLLVVYTIVFFALWPRGRATDRERRRATVVVYTLFVPVTIQSLGALKGTERRWQREPKTQIFAENRWFSQEIQAFGGRRKAQKIADFRREPKIFAGNRRKPQIGLRHLRSVTFSSAL